MNVIGIIAEYNPFHNGHLLHIEMAKQQCNASHVICVMSGHFLQRGEPALFDKWVRAEMAIAAGADIVLELPTAFSCRSAGMFARGGVETLAHTNIVTHLCFGSETGSITTLQAMASVLEHEPPAFQKLLQQELEQGVSFPSARSRALKDYLAANSHEYPTLSPNDILGVEYIIALNRLDSAIEPVAIQRRYADYHAPAITGPIASATAIRNTLQQSGLSASVGSAIPITTKSIVQRELSNQRGPLFPESLTPMILTLLRRSSAQQLTELLDVTEGLENKLKAAANIATSWEQLLAEMKSKRFTRTRLQRILMYALLGLTKEQAYAFDQHGPTYLRILGFSAKGQQLLKRMRETSTLPIIHQPADYIRSAEQNFPTLLEKMLYLDVLATDLYMLGNPTPQRGGMDFLRSVYRML